MSDKTIVSDEYGEIKYKQLKVKDGDVIVVRAGISTDAIDWLSQKLGETDRQSSIIVAVEKMSDIKSLDQRVMSNYGWYRDGRVESVSRFLESKMEEEKEREDSMAPIYNGIYYMLTGKYYE